MEQNFNTQNQDKQDKELWDWLTEEHRRVSDATDRAIQFNKNMVYVCNSWHYVMIFLIVFSCGFTLLSNHSSAAFITLSLFIVYIVFDFKQKAKEYRALIPLYGEIQAAINLKGRTFSEADINIWLSELSKISYKDSHIGEYLRKD